MTTTTAINIIHEAKGKNIAAMITAAQISLANLLDELDGYHLGSTGATQGYIFNDLMPRIKAAKERLDILEALAA